ncbi:MAG: CBS domain-containing protein [Gammaproteobacteria bacterium]|nr:MAG: CBS domain-containing protein [Gammaproteobacteria bacterium]
MSEDRPSSRIPPAQALIDRIALALGACQPRDRNQIIDYLHRAGDSGLVAADALEMIEGVFQVAEMQVRDIMIPRSAMVVIEEDAPLEEILRIVTRSGHSRFPVVADGRNRVVGILLAKDLLRYCGQNGDAEELELEDILRPAIIIPESKRLNVLLRDFRRNHNHMAIVVDEYGGVAGLVTIEDVLEQIVGEIDDEYDVDDEAYNILPHGDDRYTIKALTPIEDFNERFGTDYSDDEYDTVGGLVLKAFGHMPKRGETVDIDRFRFKVLHANNRRIGLLEMRVLPESVQDEDSTGESSDTDSE